MAKSIIVETSLSNVEVGVKNNDTILLDLLIGQYADEKFIIVHAAPSPISDDSSTNSKSCDTDAKSSLLPENFKSIDEHVVANHASQVVRMLPGGLDVVGIRLSCGLSEIANPTGELKLRRILNSIHKSTSKSFMGLVESYQEKVIACTGDGKCTFSTLDLSNKSFLSQKDMKVQTSNWLEIDYTYHFDWPLYLTKDSISPAKWVSNMLLPWANSLKETLILIDGKSSSNEELLHKQSEESQPKRKGKHSLVDFVPPKVMKAEFLDKSFLNTSMEGKDEIAWTISFSGALSGRAFLHSKADHGSAFEELKKDLVRSVHSRWEMHCDSLVGDWESAGLGQVVHEPPKRVYMEGGGLPVSLCDYLFPGDTAADACTSAKELLGINIQEENVDETQEEWADPSSLLTVQSNFTSLNAESEPSQELQATSNGNMILVFSAILGMVAIGIAYIFFTSTKISGSTSL